MSQTVISRRNIFRIGLFGAGAAAVSGLLATSPASAATKYTGPFPWTESPQDIQTKQYAAAVATSILKRTALPSAANYPYAKLTDQNLAGLISAKKAGARPVTSTYFSDGASIMWAEVTVVPGGLVIVNNGMDWLYHTNPVTGGVYLLPGRYGALAWAPKGKINTKWRSTSVGGAAKFGLPIAAREERYEGPYMSAPLVQRQTFVDRNGVYRDIYSSNVTNGFVLKGGIKTAFDKQFNGMRGIGIPISDEYEHTKYPNQILQNFRKDATLIWQSGKPVRMVPTNQL